MSYPSAFLTGFTLSAGLIVAIGAQNAFVLRQGIRQEHVGPVVLFCAVTDLALIAVGVAGLGAALQRVPGFVTLSSAGGAIFLGWYGIRAFRRSTSDQSLLTGHAGSESSLSLGATLAQVAGFTLLNPHVYLDTVILVGTVGAGQPVGSQVPFVAGAGLASAAWFAALGFGARLLAPVFARPAAWRALDHLIGGVMVALAVSLARSALAGLS